MHDPDFWTQFDLDAQRGPLDPEAASLLAMIDAANSRSFDEIGPEGARAQYAALHRIVCGEGAEVESVTVTEFGGVPCEVIVPLADGFRGAERGRGCLLWFHGGGFVIGSAEVARPLARDLAAAAGVVVVAVDYRLAPEHQFPAAVDDCLAVVDAVLGGAIEGVDVTRVAVGGDSAGGCLAAVCAVQRPDLAFQLLVYPGTDASHTAPSLEENAEGYFLTAARMRWFLGHYVPAGTDLADPRLSPLRTPSAQLSTAAPAYVLTTGFDPLRDEGRAYAQRLREAGVAVTEAYYPGQIHTFFSFGPIMAEGRTAVAAAASALATALA